MTAIILALLLSGGSNQALDFWVGRWDVFVQGKKAGSDVVEKILDGAVVLEHWSDSEGGKGESFFYFMPAKNQWKQVWVEPPIYKEKLSSAVENGIRFAGDIHLPDGRIFHDRTTLTKASHGDVHQVIERQKGNKWIVTFDAIYKRSS